MRYVYSPIYPIADRWEYSHRAGWALYWAQEAKAKVITTRTMSLLEDVNPYDEVYVYHGMEFQDALNLPGGVSDQTVWRAKLLEHVGQKIGKNLLSMDIHMPNYAELLGKRDIKINFNRMGLIRKDRPSTNYHTLVIGDSHALSLYAYGCSILRNDFKTLHGAVRQGLDTFLPEFKPKTERYGIFYFGNIDLRHHLCRPGTVDLRELLSQYVLQAIKCAKTRGWGGFGIQEPLPIDPETRVLPKSGYYNGTPFFGSWPTRNYTRNTFVDHLRVLGQKYSFDVLPHPQHFMDSGRALREDVMEKPRSVHIAPANYRLIEKGQKWTCLI